MELTLSLDEAVTLLHTSGMLPDAVTDLAGTDGAVTGKVRVQDLPNLSGAVRAATRLAGTVGVQITDRGVVGRTWTLALRASHPMVPLDLSGLVTDFVQGALVEHHVPGVVARAEGGETLVEIDLDAALGSFGAQVRVDSVAIGAQIALRASTRT
ncbi:MAG: hypothetical protein KJ548_11365 [Actinobacteria bacterium]|nr:hypothetical protein [Actinomycetota bacterium]MCG2799582.1 hypothetical protein [Cellulomonas sp.]